MTKAQLQKDIATCHFLIKAILQCVVLAESKASKKKFYASMKQLNKRIADYNKIKK